MVWEWRKRMRVIALCAAAFVASHVFAASGAEVPTNRPSEHSALYDAMCAALHPKIRAQLTDRDELQLVLEWIVHASISGVTNEADFFDSYKPQKDGEDRVTSFLQQPASFSFLTNRASRLAYIPPIPRLSLVYDDGTRSSRSRPVPGVDFPGVSYEDEGSTPYAVHLTLRAPKCQRLFKLRAEVSTRYSRDCEFKWMTLEGSPFFSSKSELQGHPSAAMAYLNANVTAVKSYRKASCLAVFVREKGGGLWGPPSVCRVEADPLCVHHYDAARRLQYIDYGDFQDWYKLDGKDRIIGFNRVSAGMVRGDDYTNFGEKLIESYADDKPKVTRPVTYAVRDGKLTFAVGDVDNQYKNEPFRYRPDNW